MITAMITMITVMINIITMIITLITIITLMITMITMKITMITVMITMITVMINISHHQNQTSDFYQVTVIRWRVAGAVSSSLGWGPTFHQKLILSQHVGVLTEWVIL